MESGLSAWYPCQMSGFFKRNSRRRQYRFASVALFAGFLTAFAPFVIDISSVLALLTIAISISSYFLLAILTYYRLRDASLSAWWLLPMIVVVQIGPSWQLHAGWGGLGFTPSGFTAFLPVVIGWFAASKGVEQVPRSTTQAG